MPVNVSLADLNRFTINGFYTAFTFALQVLQGVSAVRCCYKQALQQMQGLSI